MRYPNAFKGVKKIWLAELLLLFMAVLSLAIIIIVAVNGTLEGDQIIVSDTVLGVVGAITIITALIAIVAFVLHLVGLIGARKDEDSFKNALIMVLIGIVASVISSIWSNNTRLVKSMEVVTTLCNLFSSYYVLTGIANLADTYPDEDTKAIVLKSRSLLVGTFCATAVFKCIVTFFNLQEGSTVYSILAIVAMVLELLSYILYLRALNKGKNMLSA